MASESEEVIKLTEISDVFTLKIGGEAEIILKDLKLGMTISEVEEMIRSETE